MKLFGTTTSPFVRRVRVVAAEVGQPLELVNTATDGGQAELREVSPIWKVPVAEIGGRFLFDSRVIVDWLTTFHGWGDLRAPSDRWREANLVNAIDSALESAIQLFYLRREGMDPMTIPFGQRQVDRIDRECDVGGVLACGQVDHRPDRQALEGALVLHRRFGRAVGAPHVRATVVLVHPRHRLFDDVERDVVGVDQEHHAVVVHVNSAGPPQGVDAPLGGSERSELGVVMVAASSSAFHRRARV
jgi:hypothetical protein